MMELIRDGFVIAGKDLRKEWKTKETISVMLIFSSLVVLVFSFAFDPANQTVKTVIPGLVWLITIFSALLGLNRSFASELENGCLNGLRAAPIDPASIYIGKVIANFVLVLFVQMVSIPVLFILFDYRFAGSLLWFLATVFLGTYGLIIIGTFLAALAVNAKNSEMLLPVLLLPLLSPLMIGAVQASAAFAGGENMESAMSWIQLMAGYDLLFTAVCLLLFEYILEDS